MDRLRQHILAKLGGTAPGLEDVLAHFRFRRAARHTQILLQGETCHHLHFLAAGCLQVYGYDASYNETTRDVVLENQWCTDLTSFGTQTPAAENIRAIEDSEIFSVDWQSFELLLQAVPSFKTVYTKLLEASHISSVHRVNTLVSLDALGKIKWLLTHRPALAKRLPSKVVASYLGMSPETYSRLKHKA
jgi:CRP-like cAMP-binding protein